LDENYPREERKNIENLDISYKNLEGELDFSDFVNLKKLDCSNNKLTKLNLTELTHLKELKCYDNHLTELNYSELNADKLVFLGIFNNNSPKQDLSAFSKFVNLETL